MIKRWTKLSIFGVDDLADDGGYCGEFRVKFLDKFLNCDNPEKLFSSAQRTMLVCVCVYVRFCARVYAGTWDA